MPGACDRAPAMMIDEELYTELTLKKFDESSGNTGRALDGKAASRQIFVPESALFEGIREGWRYQALRKALKMDRQDIIRMISESNLRGRGGRGFPTGTKWASCPSMEKVHRPPVLHCRRRRNGTGRIQGSLLMEGDPHQFLEGFIVGSYAVSAEEAFIFLRWEYTLAQKRLKSAIARRMPGATWERTFWEPDVHVDLHLHVSAGRYICGEGTALVNSLEGKRAIPHSKVLVRLSVGYGADPRL